MKKHLGEMPEQPANQPAVDGKCDWSRRLELKTDSPEVLARLKDIEVRILQELRRRVSEKNPLAS